MSPAPRYAFRPVTPEDMPLLARWLRTPDVRRWWGDPDEQEALLRADLGDPQMTMLIVEWGGRPFAYVQHCRVDSWPQPYLEGVPDDAVAVDALIGEPDLLGRGHGPAFLRLLAERLLAGGAPAVVIDPDVGNVRARAAYARAGFVGDTVAGSDDGPVVLMTFAG